MGLYLCVMIAWAFNQVASIAYCGAALFTYYGINKGLADDKPEDFAYKNGLRAACMLGFLIVAFFMLFSSIMLVFKKCLPDSPLSYGILLGTCLHTGAFLLLAGLVLHSFNEKAQKLKESGVWGLRNFQTYQASYVFAYVLTATYAVLFIILLFGRMADGGVRAKTYEQSAELSPRYSSNTKKSARLGTAV